uniref:Variant surface glycoprotein 1464 n=1 Tax=Trypanosoma brucei TaxID=5691 RepID=M4SVG7_9TRYP|nr:variant surface glycoprotein 1464 [Trypanosoma brucei]
MLTAKTFLVFLLQVELLAQLSHAASENAAEFTTMCILNKLLTAKVPEPTISSLTQPGGINLQAAMGNVLQEIIKLNITTLNTKMQSALESKEPKPTETELKGTKMGVADYFKDIPDQIIKEMIALYPQTTSNSKNKLFTAAYNLPLKPEAKAKLQPLFYNLMIKAVGLNNEVDKKVEQIRAARQTAKSNMLAALYGKAFSQKKANEIKAETADILPSPAEFPFHDSDGRNASCTSAGETEDKAGYSVATDTVCLCSTLSSGTHNYCTVSAPNCQTDIAASSGAQAKAATNWQALIKECPATVAASEPAGLATELKQTLASFFALLGTNSITMGSYQATKANTASASRHFFGVHMLDNGAAPTCTSSGGHAFSANAKGICIDYGTLRQAKKEIP